MSGHFENGVWIEDPTHQKVAEGMQALLNKKIIRTKPCRKWQGYEDGSWTDDPCILRVVTPDYIVIEWIECFPGSHQVLDEDYLDGNWVEFQEPPGGYNP